MRSKLTENNLLGSRKVFLWFSLFLLMVTMAATAELTAEPAKLIFNNFDAQQLVQLRLDGQILPMDVVRDWSLLAGERNYTHMISVTPTKDGLIIGPSATAEVGSYLLIINTKHGPVQIDVETPFKEHETIIEKTAKDLGVSEEEVRANLGVSQQFQRQDVTLNLPATYYTGDMLEVEVPANGGHRSVWKINGNTVLEGQDQLVLKQMLTVAGPLEVTYEEWNGNALIASASAQSQVLQRPAMRFETTVNTPTTFRGPANYETYSWYVDNEMCCHQPAITRVFETAGTYHVTCVSSQPLDPSLKESREDVFEVTVR